MDRQQALQYVQLRRNNAPGLYNDSRLTEEPIPTTTQNVRANVQHAIRPTSLSSSSDSNQSQNSDISAPAVDQNVSSANVNKENVSPSIGLVTNEAGPSNQMQVEFVDVNASSSNESNPVLITVTTREESSNDVHTESTSTSNSNVNAADDRADLDTENPAEIDNMYDFSIDETRSRKR